MSNAQKLFPSIGSVTSSGARRMEGSTVYSLQALIRKNASMAAIAGDSYAALPASRAEDDSGMIDFRALQAQQHEVVQHLDVFPLGVPPGRHAMADAASKGMATARSPALRGAVGAWVTGSIIAGLGIAVAVGMRSSAEAHGPAAATGVAAAARAAALPVQTASWSDGAREARGSKAAMKRSSKRFTSSTGRRAPGPGVSQAPGAAGSMGMAGGVAGGMANAASGTMGVEMGVEMGRAMVSATGTTSSATRGETAGTPGATAGSGPGMKGVQAEPVAALSTAPTGPVAALSRSPAGQHAGGTSGVVGSKPGTGGENAGSASTPEKAGNQVVAEKVVDACQGDLMCAMQRAVKR
ncbi:hypothetical protein [Chondromyces crocatus]|uniref:Uncharacterized protein n=1 Tax=Chondromyces crocatus TaxID=52 RepID=A0A0K1EIH3_CHOCO|nr:hypothetical protein [Chondromyces crocatus]AKT40655.1 uncharacterized protein CMC5_048110 [Chondromyces crocatus]